MYIYVKSCWVASRVAHSSDSANRSPQCVTSRDIDLPNPHTGSAKIADPDRTRWQECSPADIGTDPAHTRPRHESVGASSDSPERLIRRLVTGRVMPGQRHPATDTEDKLRG